MPGYSKNLYSWNTKRAKINLMPNAGLGSGINFSGLVQQPPPFNVNAADNGVSVDPVSGRIVLGRDVGVPGNGDLLSDREIQLNGNSIMFTDNGFTYFLVDPPPQSLYVFGDAGGSLNGGRLEINDISGQVTLNNGPGSSAAQVFLDGDDILLRNQGGQRFLDIDRLNDTFGFGDLDVSGQGTFIEINNPMGLLNISNAALTAAVNINGVNGFTGTVLPVLSITVDGGIVTNVT